MFSIKIFIRLPLIICLVLCIRPEFAGASEATENEDSFDFKKSIYDIDPFLDGSIILMGAVISGYAYSHSGTLINPNCPCKPSEVNSFDRYAIGNENAYHDKISDISVLAALIFPVALDYHDVGATKEFIEDMVIYAEALSVNGGFVTFAKYSVQRPIP